MDKPSLSNRPRPYRALCLSVTKSGFLQDIQEVFRDPDDFDLVTWPPYALGAIASQFLSPSTNDSTYLESDVHSVESKEAYRRFLAKVWQHYCWKRKIDLVLSPNFFYYKQRALASALEEMGTPFIVLHKENLKSPGRVEYWRYMYTRRGKFAGRKILVYNDTEKNLLLSAGVVSKDRVVVTGMPRLDKIHRWRRDNANKMNGAHAPTILFFAFDQKDKLPKQDQNPPDGDDSESETRDRWAGLTWAHVCENTHLAILELARRRPDISVIVKSKAIGRQRNEVLRLLQGQGERLPENLKVVIGGDPFRLLTESKAVVAFNTTAQLEALAAGKPVIVPWFDEAVDLKTRDFVIDLGDAVEYARSPDQIVEIACRLLDDPNGQLHQLRASDNLALDQWTGNKDGAAGKRVLEIIKKEVKNSSGRSQNL